MLSIFLKPAFEEILFIHVRALKTVRPPSVGMSLSEKRTVQALITEGMDWSGMSGNRMPVRLVKQAIALD